MSDPETPTVVRFDHWCDLTHQHEMERNDNSGVWVPYTDYLTLHTDLQRAAKERDAARAAYRSTQEKVLFEYERAEKVEAEHQRLREEHARLITEVRALGTEWHDEGAVPGLRNTRAERAEGDLARLRAEKEQGFQSCISLTVTFNEHAVYYEPVETCAAVNDDLEWVSDAEREKAIQENSVWTCQWYPRTPVGFHVLAASSFAALMAAVKAHEEAP